MYRKLTIELILTFLIFKAKVSKCLNAGIAWDKEKRRLFVTGKYWPSVFEVVLRPHPGRLKPETIELARQRCII